MPLITFGFDDYETTPLAFAAFHGDLDVLKRLISEGSDTSETDGRGKTPLYYALERNHTQAALALLKSGAKVSEQFGPHFLVQAAASGAIEVLKFLLREYSHVDEPQENGWTALTAAVQSGNRAVIEFLIKEGASPDGRGPDGLLPLQIAVTCRNQESITSLLDSGADVNAINLQGLSTLRFISEYQNVDFSEGDRKAAIELLQANGAKYIPPLSLWQRVLRS